MAESVAKSSDVLGARVDRAASEMKERFEGDLRRINDRLADVADALRRSGPDRIELE
jgi:hypothetical protein